MERETVKEWLTRKIHETPTGVDRERYTDAQIVLYEFESELKEMR